MRCNVILDELIMAGLIITLLANVCALHVFLDDELLHCLRSQTK